MSTLGLKPCLSVGLLSDWMVHWCYTVRLARLVGALQLRCMGCLVIALPGPWLVDSHRDCHMSHVCVALLTKYHMTVQQFVVYSICKRAWLVLSNSNHIMCVCCAVDKVPPWCCTNSVCTAICGDTVPQRQHHACSLQYCAVGFPWWVTEPGLV